LGPKQTGAIERPVFAIVVEPVGGGLADNLQRPGGNVTGVTTFDPEQAGRQLQLSKVIGPGLGRVAIPSDRGVSECLSDSNRQSHRTWVYRHKSFVWRAAAGVREALAAMDQKRAGALVVLQEPSRHREATMQHSTATAGDRRPSVPYAHCTTEPDIVLDRGPPCAI
jgi:hypothetical protein